MYTDHAPVKGISARARGQGCGNGAAVLLALAILHERSYLRLSRMGQSNLEVAAFVPLFLAALTSFLDTQVAP